MSLSNFNVIKNEDGTAMIAKLQYYTEHRMWRVTIPSEYEGYKITRLGAKSFDVNAWEVIIPDSITTIDDYAFEGRYGLESISIPDSVVSIGRNPFKGCPIKSISISKDHPTLALVDGALFNKKTKTLIRYLNSYHLEDYSIPNGIRAIDDYAFDWSSQLNSVSIPSSVISIGKNPFSGRRQLLVKVSADNPILSIIDNALIDKSTQTLVGYLSNEDRFPSIQDIETYSIPDGLKIIGTEAFRDVRRIKSISIPNSVTSIEDRAFYECDCHSIHIPKSVENIGEQAFYHYDKSRRMLIVERDSVAESYAKKWNYNYALTDALDWLNS